METGLDDKVNGALGERKKKEKEGRGKNETDGGNTSGRVWHANVGSLRHRKLAWQWPIRPTMYYGVCTGTSSVALSHWLARRS